MASTTGPKDYYKILGVSCNASSAELRQAYREQALRHHPDKNPERVQDATEMFKLVAEAYSVLRDDNQRMQYDRGRQRERCSSAKDVGSFTGYTFAGAKDLFSEVFGEEIASSLGRVASITTTALTETMVRCGRSDVVKGVMTAGFSSMAAEADEDVTKWEQADSRCQTRLELRQRELHELGAAFAKQQTLRDARADEDLHNASWQTVYAISFNLCGVVARFEFVQDWLFPPNVWPWPFVLWILVSCSLVCCSVRRWAVWVRRRMQSEQSALREAREMKELRMEVEAAKRAVRTARQGLAHAREASARVREDLAMAAEHGLSVGGAAKIGLHFCGRLLESFAASSAIAQPDILPEQL